MYAAARTRLLAGTIAALTITTVLAGCSSQPTDPNAWKSDVPDTTASATPTPSATGYTPVSKPGKAAPPKDENNAWVHASAVVKDFINVQYEIQHDTGKSPDRIDDYATSSLANAVHDVARQLAKQKITTNGAPKWTADAAASSYGSVFTHEGKTIENGTVYVAGCYDVTNQKPVYANGSPAPVSAVRVAPFSYRVQYLDDEKAWKVVGSTKLDSSAQGVPQC